MTELPSREFLAQDESTLTLYQSAPESPSRWQGCCPTCGQLNTRFTCYRCHKEIEYPPSIRLQPPYGSLDARSDNWLCPPCLVEFQVWAGATPAIVTRSQQTFMPEVSS